MKRLYFFACLPLALVLAGCSDAPQKAEVKEPPKPPEPIGALSAVRAMWIQARAWSPDALPLRVTSMNLKEIPSVDGKAGGWDATFVSESLQRTRRYTYGVAEVPSANLRKGVFGGPIDSWSNGRQKPIAIQALKTDTTAALKTALEKGGADYVKKHPEMPVQFLLESTAQFPNPTWRVIWGDSISTSNFSVFVDVTTGEFLQIAH